MKGETLSSTSFSLFVFLAFFVMLSTAPTKLAGGVECGGTVGDCMETTGGGESEFLMDSETSRRLLFGGSKHRNHLVYKPVYEKGPICNSHRYGSCIGGKRKPVLSLI
nr:rapid alkalinization factor 5 [Ipomoea batatas]GME14755.1 rapid alkalinization factor 5 [Ipomoea batatas]GME20735.1 rapid alkalinization factor 5 [Ipomoea batatas]